MDTLPDLRYSCPLLTVLHGLYLSIAKDERLGFLYLYFGRLVGDFVRFWYYPAEGTALGKMMRL